MSTISVSNVTTSKISSTGSDSLIISTGNTFGPIITMYSNGFIDFNSNTVNFTSNVTTSKISSTGSDSLIIATGNTSGPTITLSTNALAFANATSGYSFDASVSTTGNFTANTFSGGPLGGLRNKIINGDFDIWQRGTSQTSSGYGSDDRWHNANSGSTKTASRQPFAAGQTDVPGNPLYFSRTVVASVAGAGNYVGKFQRIENVRTLAGKTATLTFWAKADANKNIALELAQSFGSGGSPSTGAPLGLKALTTSWQKFSFTVAVPSISGKTIGTNDFLQVFIWFDAGSDYNANASSLGQQSGTFDIAHVSIVEGDATNETDPFSPRHIQQELALCQRYYETGSGAREVNQTDGAIIIFSWTTFHVPKRVTPTVTVATGTMYSAQVDGFQAYLVGVSVSGEYNPGIYTADAEL